MTFGEYFRQKRVNSGFTLRKFCEMYQFDPGNISRLERNILSPTLDEKKLAGYAIALKMKHDSEEWVTFFDLANIAKGKIPVDIMKDQNMLSMLPAFYRTARGKKLGKDKIKQLVELLNNSSQE